MTREIFIAEPNGMCGGVRRALQKVEEVLSSLQEQLYVLHEIVHNDHIVGKLAARGVRFVNDLSEIPDGGTVILSAHGVGAEVEKTAAQKHLKVYDATCPLVKKLHHAVQNCHGNLIIYGHLGHPEVTGILGQSSAEHNFVVQNLTEARSFAGPGNDLPFTAVSQTTVNAEEADKVFAELKRKIPRLQIIPGVCYATSERQLAVRELCKKVDIFLILGSPRSSNSNRLREIAEECGVKAFLINHLDELPMTELRKARKIGLSAGASAPDELLQTTYQFLQKEFIL